jgi:quinone-modifying oxidoreductase subunit QmoA
MEARKPILVLGGGMAGLTTALEAAEAGCAVILVEKEAYLGGRVARSYLYFPKLCPPDCGLEINFKRLKSNPQVQVLTLAELESLNGVPGNYQATIRVRPRYVNERCTDCGECAKFCPAERLDDFNYGLSKTKAAYLPYGKAFPAQYVIDRSACPDACRACADACPYGAIELDQAEERKTVQVSAVVAATGWAPYNAAKLENLGYGKFPNVVTNVMMERMAAASGPTGGRILRPSDGAEPASVAFVQCAGSRDENHLPYCSAVCCAASLKQATYVRRLYPNAPVSIFYIDLRTPGRLEDFLTRVAADPNTELIKGRVGKVEQDPGTQDLLVTVEDISKGKKEVRRFSLLVLAVGIVPQTDGLPAAIGRDEYGFVQNGVRGLYGTGCARRPGEVAVSVQDATGAALRALICAVGIAANG